MKKVVSAIILFVVSTSCYSQTESADKKFEFGFNLGVNRTNLIVDFKSNYFGPLLENKTGVDFGVLMSYNPVNWLSIVPVTEISFNNASLDYYSWNDILGNLVFLTNDKIYPVSIAFKTHFQIKPFKGNVRPYFIVGPSVRVDIEKDMITTNYKSPPNFALDFGIGLDKIFDSFTFSPEIIYSYGFTELSPIVEGIRYHKLSLVLNFKD